MNNLELVNRLISMESEIQGSKLRNGKLEEYEWTQLNFAIEKLSDAPLYIDDTPSLNVFELRAKCRRLHQNHGISMVIIDYLQLMTAGGSDKRSSREQEISTISRALKGLAKELSIPVIALSQLNRQVETGTGNKKPQLSHLRESGAIEQDADMVMFIYRENYYEATGEVVSQEVRGLTELIVAKHRNGATDTIKILFKEQFAKFVPYEEDQNIFGFGATPNIKIIPSKINDDDAIPF
jgi:replicative DNA helicase